MKSYAELYEIVRIFSFLFLFFFRRLDKAAFSSEAVGAA
jgi:hypothetical protein